MLLQHLSLTLETVTPLLLGGAEPRTAVELRPPAFRGVLRYWFRAAAGGVIGDSNLAGLHRMEAAVFGDTSRGSSVVLRLPEPGSLATFSAPILPHRDDQHGRRSAFRDGQRFALLLHGRAGTSDEAWRAACAVAQLALTCGGVGLRSRRGYGTLRIAESSDQTLIPPFPTDLEGWVRHVERAADAAVSSTHALARDLNVPAAPLPAGPTSYPCANKQGLLWIASADGASTAMDAVKEFMRRVPLDRALGGINPRQASPLWVRPIATGSGQYSLLFTVLASRLAQQAQNYTLIGDFLHKRFRNGRELEVPGWNR